MPFISCFSGFSRRHFVVTRILLILVMFFSSTATSHQLNLSPWEHGQPFLALMSPRSKRRSTSLLLIDQTTLRYPTCPYIKVNTWKDKRMIILVRQLSCQLIFLRLPLEISSTGRLWLRTTCWYVWFRYVYVRVRSAHRVFAFNRARFGILRISHEPNSTYIYCSKRLLSWPSCTVFCTWTVTLLGASTRGLNLRGKSWKKMINDLD